MTLSGSCAARVLLEAIVSKHVTLNTNVQFPRYLKIASYAGPESKIMLNDKGPRFKRSKLDKVINVCAVLFCAVLLLFMCVSSAAGQWVWTAQEQDSMRDYIPIDQSLIGNSVFLTALVSALTFLIYYQVRTRRTTCDGSSVLVLVPVHVYSY